jgi:hypothetical protein
MADIVDLKSRPAPTKDDLEFISDMARFSEQVLSEQAIRKKYRMFDDAAWQKLGADDDLVRAIEAESVRRIRDGSAKREKAQKLVVAAPDVLSGILLDNTANARHRIDSAKELNNFAAPLAGQGAPMADRFIIQINLGADTLTFNKSIAIDPNDREPQRPHAIRRVSDDRGEEIDGERWWRQHYLTGWLRNDHSKNQRLRRLPHRSPNRH